MNDKQFNLVCQKLDKIAAMIAVQKIDDKDKQVYILKKSGLSSEEIGDLLGIKNPRQMEGWKRK
jgi:DNA-directed RNA polymerase specialized sigma subunit